MCFEAGVARLARRMLRSAVLTWSAVERAIPNGYFQIALVRERVVKFVVWMFPLDPRLGFPIQAACGREAAKNSFTPLLCAACRISVPSCQALREHERGRQKVEPAGSDERVEWRRHQIASRSSLCVSSRRRTEDGSGDAAGSRRPHVLGAVRRKGKQPPSLST